MLTTELYAAREVSGALVTLGHPCEGAVEQDGPQVHPWSTQVVAQVPATRILSKRGHCNRGAESLHRAATRG